MSSSSSHYAFLSEIWGTPDPGPRHHDSASSKNPNKKNRKKAKVYAPSNAQMSPDVQDVLPCAMDRVMDVYTLENPYAVGPSQCPGGPHAPGPGISPGYEDAAIPCYQDDEVFEDPECRRPDAYVNCQVGYEFPTKSVVASQVAQSNVLQDTFTNDRSLHALGIPSTLNTQNNTMNNTQNTLNNTQNTQNTQNTLNTQNTQNTQRAQRAQSTHIPNQMAEICGPKVGFHQYPQASQSSQSVMYVPQVTRQQVSPPQISNNQQGSHLGTQPNHGFQEYFQDATTHPYEATGGFYKDLRAEGVPEASKPTNTQVTTGTSSFFYEMFMYIISGVLLIFVMDQMVKLGASLRSTTSNSPV